MQESKVKVGPLYQEVRTRRDLPIKTVRQRLTSSAISHFERDNNDVRLSNLIILLKPTYMEIGEFTQLVDSSVGQLKKIFGEIAKYYDALDSYGMRQICARYANVTMEDTPKYLIKLITSSCLGEIEHRPQIFTEEDSEFVQSYLLEPGRWFKFEYIVFANSLSALSDNANMRIFKRMVDEYSQFHLREYDDLFAKAIFNLSVIALEKRQFESVHSLISVIEKESLPAQELYIRHHITFIGLVLNVMEQPNKPEYRSKLSRFLETTRMIDAGLYEKNVDWLWDLGIGGN